MDVSILGNQLYNAASAYVRDVHTVLLKSTEYQLPRDAELVVVFRQPADGAKQGFIQGTATMADVMVGLVMKEEDPLFQAIAQKPHMVLQHRTIVLIHVCIHQGGKPATVHYFDRGNEQAENSLVRNMTWALLHAAEGAGRVKQVGSASCWHCLRLVGDTHRCKSCWVARYCSRECRKQHQVQHQDYCTGGRLVLVVK